MALSPYDPTIHCRDTSRIDIENRADPTRGIEHTSENSLISMIYGARSKGAPCDYIAELELRLVRRRCQDLGIEPDTLPHIAAMLNAYRQRNKL